MTQQDQERRVFDDEFGITSHFIGNGCEHGFKPARSCPNSTCKYARLHRWWDEQAAPASMLTESEAIDKVARALFEAEPPHFQSTCPARWEDAIKQMKKLFLKRAQAALSAAGVRFKEEA